MHATNWPLEKMLQKFSMNFQSIFQSPRVKKASKVYRRKDCFIYFKATLFVNFVADKSISTLKMNMPVK